MPDDTERHYREREVELILRRAAELQTRSEDEDTSLTELEEIADRVGIDVEHIRLAAAQLDEIGPLPSVFDRIVGGPITIWLERTVSGEVPEASIEDLAAELETGSGGEGQAALIGRSLTWRAHDPNNTRALLVSVRWADGRTHIRILERLHGLVGGLFGGTVGGLGVGMGLGVGLGVGLGALGSPLFATIFPPVVLVGSYLLARTIFRAVSQSRERRLRELLELISDYVSEDTVEEAGEEAE